jgi:DNA-binding Lrp family transcriptional regulator
MAEKIHELDARDWAIIELLRAGTISNSAVAKELGVSEGMIRQRIKRLREHGILSLRGLINPDILANRQVVWLGANVAESRLLEKKAEEIARLENVLSVSISSGRFRSDRRAPSRHAPRARRFSDQRALAGRWNRADRELRHPQDVLQVRIGNRPFLSIMMKIQRISQKKFDGER